MTAFQKDILSLIKSAVFNTKASVSNNFNWRDAVKLGYSHKVLPLLFYGAYNSNIKIPDEFYETFSIAAAQYLISSEQQLYDLKEITQAFSDGKIDHLPLKGSVLKSLYPKPELRPMGDIDILIKMDQYDDIKRIMTELGYYEERISDHELNWFKGKKLVELHKRLIPSYNEDFYEYFDDGWKHAIPISEGSSTYTFSPDDNFIYLFTHFSKHYRDAGIGILHLVDMYLYLHLHHNRDLDNAYIRRELNKLGLLKFYINILDTIDVCFYGHRATDITDHIVNRIFTSGSYGDPRSQMLSTAVKKTKKVKHKRMFRVTLFFKRVFMPHKEMCKRHSILKRLPFLLPVFWIYRIFSVLFFKRENIKKELESIKISGAENVTEYYNNLKYVGLDFNFYE